MATTQINIDKLERIQDRILRTIEYKCVEKRENIDVLKARYAVEKLCVRRKRNLLKIMFNESHNDDNIDYYRPERVLRSEDKVKIKSKFTRITKVQKSPFYRALVCGMTYPWHFNMNKVNHFLKEL